MNNLVSWVERHWHSFSSQTENILHVFSPFPQIVHITHQLSLPLCFSSLKRTPSSQTRHYTVCLEEAVSSLLFWDLLSWAEPEEKGEGSRARDEYALSSCGSREEARHWIRLNSCYFYPSEGLTPSCQINHTNGVGYFSNTMVASRVSSCMISALAIDPPRYLVHNVSWASIPSWTIAVFWKCVCRYPCLMDLGYPHGRDRFPPLGFALSNFFKLFS